ncbi:thiol-disulfide oxidoreductase DCC family protein [Carboxylicivirga sp. N1Y90]|uniref:thiol-disulfide oxidoreductase DCC family protein n=1 Tax=Carboxylicivirga fragile TaxID=3417571 RepID=UPI003D33B9DA|nr:DUF393 domain-containing protein [Marinilabiliaceae bacterium N1Y90]
MKASDSHKNNITIYYDGWCRLCTGFVGRLARLDKFGRIQFVPLQSLDVGVKTQEAVVIKPQLNMDEVILLKNENVFTGANAVIEVLKTLGGVANVIGITLSYLPSSFNNWLYRLIARYRYRIFGRVHCALPKI